MYTRDLEAYAGPDPDGAHGADRYALEDCDSEKQRAAFEYTGGVVQPFSSGRYEVTGPAWCRPIYDDLPAASIPSSAFPASADSSRPSPLCPGAAAWENHPLDASEAGEGRSLLSATAHAACAAAASAATRGGWLEAEHSPRLPGLDHELGAANEADALIMTAALLTATAAQTSG